MSVLIRSFSACLLSDSCCLQTSHLQLSSIGANTARCWAFLRSRLTPPLIFPLSCTYSSYIYLSLSPSLSLCHSAIYRRHSRVSLAPDAAAARTLLPFTSPFDPLPSGSWLQDTPPEPLAQTGKRKRGHSLVLPSIVLCAGLNCQFELALESCPKVVCAGLNCQSKPWLSPVLPRVYRTELPVQMFG